MASQYSILREYTPYVSPYNLDVLAAGMQYKQERVDANRAMLNNYATQILDMEIAKPQDREYLENRLNNLVQEVNKNFYGQDLSSQGVAMTIQNKIGESIDTKVVNAVASTRKWRKFMTDMEEMKLKYPKLYSPVNEQHAMQGYYNWSNDGQVGSLAPDPHYTPYTDYNKELNDNIQQMIKNKKVQKVKYPDPDHPGYMIEKEFDQCTKDEIRLAAEGMLSASARAQMGIDGWYMAISNPGMFDVKTTSEFVSKGSRRYDDRIALLTEELNKSGSDEARRNEIKQSIETTKRMKENYISKAQSVIGETYDPVRAATFMVEENFLNGLADRYAYNANSVSYSSDPTYIDNQKQKLDIEKAAWDRQQDLWERGFKEKELQVTQQYRESMGQAALIRAAGKAGATSSGMIGTGRPESPYTFVTRADDNQQEINNDILYQNINEGTVVLRTQVPNMLAKTNDKGQYLTSLLQAKRNEGQYQGVNDEDAIVDIIANTPNAISMRGMTPAAYKEFEVISKAKQQKDKALDFSSSVSKLYVDVINQNMPQLMDKMIKNGETYFYNGQEHKVTDKTPIDQAQNIKASGVARYLINNNAVGTGNYHEDGTFGAERFGYVPRLSSNILNPENIGLIQGIIDANGDNFSVLDLIVKDPQSNANVYMINPELENSNTGKMMVHYMRENTSFVSKGLSGPIRSMFNSDAIGDLLGSTDLSNLSNEMFKEYIGSQARYKNRTISKGAANEEYKNDQFNKTKDGWTSLAAQNGIKLGEDPQTYLNKINGFEYSTIKDPEKGLVQVLYPKGEPDKAVIVPPTFFKENGIENYVEDTRQIPITDMKTITVDSLTYPTPSGQKVLESVLGGQSDLIRKAGSEEDTRRYLRDKYNSVFQFIDENGQAQSTGLRESIDQIVDGISNLRFEAESVPESGQIRFRVWDKNDYQYDPDNPIIDEYYDLPENDNGFVDDYVRTLRVIPQYYFVSFLDDIILAPMAEDIMRDMPRKPEDIAHTKQLKRLLNATRIRQQ